MAGGVKKLKKEKHTHTQTQGAKEGHLGAAITREQQETRGLLVAGREACGWGLREGRFNQVVFQRGLKKEKTKQQ